MSKNRRTINLAATNPGACRWSWMGAASMLALFLSLFCSPYSLAITRTLEFEPAEVSQPALNLAPDGRSFVFNLLGHLFRLPVTGGTATQITFGPVYDSEPAFSPDGAKIAFVSNRDGGGVVLLDADPLEDLKHTMKIWRVVKDGHVFDPATMR
jgi:hypothetical protein